MSTIAINGLGRIGRAALKIALDTPELVVGAVNDIASAENLAYLLKLDTVYGRYAKPVDVQGDSLRVDGKTIRLFRERDPERLPWKALGIDLVLECTGVFTQRDDLAKHLRAGAAAVILSAPAVSEDVPTVVHGVNRVDGASAAIVSCASCTTNCITPVVEVMGRRIGVRKATMTTIHAYTASQALVDSPHRHPRRGRAAAANFVPTSTGAATATTRALPEFRGRFGGLAIRGPVPVGSLADLVFLTTRPTTVEEVNRIFREEAESERYRGILGVSEDPIVSSDIIQDPRASIVDLELTQVVDGDLVKILSWYDNEWGYTSQMIREAVHIGAGRRQGNVARDGAGVGTPMR
jgi:glyceraldehyde 3-phosphate dehydrogenase